MHPRTTAKYPIPGDDFCLQISPFPTVFFETHLIGKGKFQACVKKKKTIVLYLLVNIIIIYSHFKLLFFLEILLIQCLILIK